MNIHVEHDGLTPEIYINLRKKVNFKFYGADDVALALRKNLYSVVVYDGTVPVGIGRVVGDDRIVFFIKDIVVDPQYQKKNIGNLVMQNILNYIAGKACEGAYIGLMSTCGTEEFYKKMGFIERPNASLGPGMVKFFCREEGMRQFV